MVSNAIGSLENPMNITKCYKILELENGASAEDARKAYKDMVRVWHPDRFGDNPRLRAKANEKLKELNLAYGQIRKLQAKGLPEHPQAEKAGHEKNTPQAEKNAFLFTKKIREFLSKIYRRLGTGTDFRKHLRALMFSRTPPKRISPEPSRQYSNKFNRASGPKIDARTKRRPFSEILQEVARAKKRKMKYADERSKNNPL
jgi:curved DNA-binding protein CbpA